MTITSSYPISLGNVMDELRIANAERQYPISLGDTDVRALAGVPSGNISLSNLLGKSSAITIYMVVGQYTNADGETEYGYNSPVAFNPYGSLSPTTLKGNEFAYITEPWSGGLSVAMRPALSQDYFRTLTINGVIFNTANVSLFYSQYGYTNWIWTPTPAPNLYSKVNQNIPVKFTF